MKFECGKLLPKTLHTWFRVKLDSRYSFAKKYCVYLTWTRTCVFMTWHKSKSIEDRITIFSDFSLKYSFAHDERWATFSLKSMALASAYVLFLADMHIIFIQFFINFWFQRSIFNSFVISLSLYTSIFMKISWRLCFHEIEHRVASMLI